MNTKLIIGAITILIILALAFVFGQKYLQTGGLFTPTTKVTINNHAFSVAIAKSSKDKQVGLSSRASLGKDEGMIFSFGTPDYYHFWMKNMKFPIDIIYIKDRKIVTILDNVPVPTTNPDNPETYQPTEAADTVLEIGAGVAKQYGIKVGDSVTIDAKNEDLRN